MSMFHRRAEGAPAPASPDVAPRIRARAFAAAFVLLAACGAQEAAPDETEQEAHEGGHEESHAEEGHADEAIVRLSEADLRAAGIALARAETGPTGGTLDLPAEIGFDPDRLANISVPLEGTVAELPVTEGDSVAQGDALAVVSSRELADLKAEFIAAQAAEELARAELVRAEALYAANAVAEAELQSDRAAHARAVAARTGAETKLHALGLEHDLIDRLSDADDGAHARFTLRSPIAGRVLRRSLTLGQTLRPEDAVVPAFVVADTEVVWARVAVFGADLGAVREGAAVELAGDSGAVLARGNVGFVSPVIAEGSRTGEARVVIVNADGALRPGQLLTARIETGQGAPALRVPANAVQTVDGGPAVFVPKEDGFAPRAVQTGRTGGGWVEIVSGLSEGESFVATGAFTLKAELESSSFGDGHVH